MEFIMDLIMELILEIFVEGSLDLAGDKEVPRWLRITALTIATAFYLACTVLFVIIFIQCKNVFLRILIGGIILLFVGILGRFWYRLYKKR